MTTPEFFDATWLENGEFDLSQDNRNKTRTMLTRDALVDLHDNEEQLRLHPLPSRGRAYTYYIRQHDPGEPHAQYVMGLDDKARDSSCPRAAGLLSLGVSVEKGFEPQQMTGSWSWHRLAKASPTELDQMITAIASKVKRPVSISIDAHRPDSERHPIEYVYANGLLLRHACPSSLNELQEHIASVNAKMDHWVDFWLTVHFGFPDVEKMPPLAAANIIYHFRDLRDWLNGVN